MPTYDYECDQGHRFELFQSMKDAPLTACTQCGAPAHRRIGTGAGFIFKGGGFYITEYRSKEYKDKAKAESSGGAPAGGDAAKSSDKGSGSTAKPASGGTPGGGKSDSK
jgi:putative FmdB family regulatory protein